MTTPALPTQPVTTSSGDKLLAVLCHLSLFLGFAFILPLIVYLVKKGESDFVAMHAKEALNFHISLLIYFICLIPLIFIVIGIPIYAALGIMAFVCSIIAVVKVADGAFYSYPLTIRLIS